MGRVFATHPPHEEAVIEEIPHRRTRLVAIVAMLAPPVLAQQPKVTITGLVDNVLSFYDNYSRNDLDLLRRERQVNARTRARPDITPGIPGRGTGPGVGGDVAWRCSRYLREQGSTSELDQSEVYHVDMEQQRRCNRHATTNRET